jgi:ABC-2 type transport system permease protein
MRPILKIAQLEIRYLFYSPIAWCMVLVFCYQRFDKLNALLMDTIGWLETNSQFDGLTRYFVWWGLFTDCKYKLYLFIPLVTMSVISREWNTGSIKLLFSSPVKNSEIVWGKFLAMVVYCLALVFILLICLLEMNYLIVSADWGMMLTGLLGLFLLMCLYSAIGIFMSSLTSYQLVAAVSTFAVLAGVENIGTVGQQYSLMRSVSYFLSISRRTEHFIDGLISSKDLIYMLLMTALFIILTILKLRSARESRPWYVFAARYAITVTIILYLGYLSGKAGYIRYYDATYAKTQTPLPQTIQLLQQIKTPLNVHTYINLLDPESEDRMPDNRNKDIIFWEPYQRFLKNPIQIDYTYFYDTTTSYINNSRNGQVPMRAAMEYAADGRNFDTKDVVTPEEIRKKINLKSYDNKFVRQLQVNDRTSMIGLFSAAEDKKDPNEPEMATTFKLLLNDRRPVIGMLSGHGEREALDISPDGYSKRFGQRERRGSIINQGFEVKDLILKDSNDLKNISILYIADPKTAFTQEELQILQQYVDSGGNMIIAGEPGRHDLLRPLTRPIGVDFMDGTLIQNNQEYAPDYTFAYFTRQSSAYSRQLKELYDAHERIASSSMSALQYNNKGSFHIEPFIVTDSATTWNRVKFYSKDSVKIGYDASAGDLKESLPVAVSLTRRINNKQQKIIILGDADYMANSQINFVPKKNSEISQEILRWLSDGEFPVDTYRKPRPDNQLRVTRSYLYTYYLIFYWCIPAVILLGGLSLLIFRWRK